MFVDELKIRDFCNLREVNLKFNSNLNIFFGDNAQGKTNIIEAIYYLNKSKSFRKIKDQDLVRWNKDIFFLKGNIVNNTDTHQVSVLFQNLKKEVKIDNKKIFKQSKIFNLFNCVIFSPEDLHILNKTPTLRRYFLNSLISQVNEKYLYHLRKYHKTLLSRNKILSDRRNFFKKDKILESLDNLLVNEGIEIIKIRYEVISELTKIVSDVYSKILSLKGLFEIIYKPSIFSDNLEKEFYDKLHKYKENEIKRGFTLTGPHKDDLIFTFKGINIGSFGSQGQKRMAAIAIRFGELYYVYKKTEKFPLLLLDDVFSELDQEKKKNFTGLLNNQIQVFITTTSLEFLKGIGFGNYLLFQIKDGEIVEK